jgi:transposase
MLVVETIAKIRRAHFVEGKSIKQICRELRVSRNTVRKVIRSGATEFTYDRTTQPRPKIDPWRSELDEMLAENARRPKRERLTLIRIYEELRNRGYDGGYDAVRRYAASWSKATQEASASAYVPLSFDPGEAYQFDWSHEIVILDGVTTTVKVAHVRLCHSRMPFVRAYPRETQEMVFDAHDKAFAFFGGACARGIYDNMKTAVDTIFVGKDRAYNRRFQQMCGHYLVEPVACTPGVGLGEGPGREPGGRAPAAVLRAAAEVQILRRAERLARGPVHRLCQGAPHPDMPDKTIWEVFEAERPSLVPYVGPFDGFHAVPASSPRPASCASTRTATRSMPARSGGRSRSAPMPTGWNAGRTARLSANMIAPSAAARRSTIRCITSRSWRASPARCATARRSRTGTCRRPCAACSASWNASPAATGRWSRSSAPCSPTAGRRRSRLRRGLVSQRPFRRDEIIAVVPKARFQRDGEATARTPTDHRRFADRRDQ